MALIQYNNNVFAKAVLSISRHIVNNTFIISQLRLFMSVWTISTLNKFYTNKLPFITITRYQVFACLIKIEVPHQLFSFILLNNAWSSTQVVEVQVKLGIYPHVILT